MEAKQRGTWRDKLDCTLDVYHVGVADGIRVLAVLMVVWFHFWQQTWLMPVYQTPFLSWLHVSSINPIDFRRVGYIFVDMMILLSGFLLFLPYARSMFLGEPYPSVKLFYRRRVARILPSYLLSIAVLFVVALVRGSYSGPQEMWRDLLSHLTFTQTFRMDTLAYTKLNVALWTVAIEMQFYLVFPLLAKAFSRFHILIYALMVGAGLAFIQFVSVNTEPIALGVNQFPTFLPVFANGMLAACLYVLYAKYVHIKRPLGYFFFAVSLLCLYLIAREVKSCSAAANAQIWQLTQRYTLSILFTLFVLSTAFSFRAYRFLFSNTLMRLLGTLSFNLYIWHQWIMVMLRQSLGFLSGADVAAAGTKIQALLTLEALGLSLFVAAVLTWFFEKPMYRLMMKEKIKEALT